MTAPKLILVTSAPKLLHPVMLSGIQTKERAKAWAERNNYPVVYFWRRAERVYVEKPK